MNLSIIAAVADNSVIGRAGDLPWRLRADLHRFRHLTLGRTVIAGRKTQEAIVRRLGGLLTHVHVAIAGDAFFPPFDAQGWRVISRESHPADADNDYPHTFEVLVRSGPG